METTNESKILTFTKDYNILHEDEIFASLTARAISLYGKLKSYEPLSRAKKRMIGGYPYVYPSFETLQAYLRCSKRSAQRALKELRDFGLVIVMKAFQGAQKGRNNIYVLVDLEVFIAKKRAELGLNQPEQEPEQAVEPEKTEAEKKAEKKIVELMAPYKTYESAISVVENNTNHNDNDSFAPDTCQIDTSPEDNSAQEQVSEIAPNRIHSNKIDSHQTHHHPVQSQVRPAFMRRRRWTREELMNDFCLMWRKENEVMFSQEELSMLDSLIQTAAAALSKREWFNINTQRVSAEEVRLRLMMLDYEAISYVIDYLSNHPSRCSNPSAYYIAVLYNAPDEAENYWDNLVRNDTYRTQKWGDVA